MAEDPNILDPEWDAEMPDAPFRAKAMRAGARAGAQELGATLYEIDAGGAISPYHFHHANEELLIVLAGAPEIRTPAGRRRLEAGAVMAFARGEDGAHAVATLGFDEAVERANRALRAGADVAFVEAPETRDQLAAVPRLVEGPCLLNLVAAGKTPDLTLAEAAEMGFRLAIVPVLLIGAAIRASEAALEDLRATGAVAGIGDGALSVHDIFSRAGARAWDEVRGRYGGE